MAKALKIINRFKGEVAEWLKAAVSKTAILSNRDRGFESHPLRHCNRFDINKSFFVLATNWS
jgi:hypothetical protein